LLASRAALLHEAVDRQSAESFTIKPVVPRYGPNYAGGPGIDVNARPLPDPDRATETFSAIWTEPQSMGGEVRRPHVTAREAPGGAGRHPSLSRPVVKYADTELPWRPGVGYLVTRVSTGETFSVAEIHIDGYGRSMLILTGRAA
jgi:hypothetical protein